MGSCRIYRTYDNQDCCSQTRMYIWTRRGLWLSSHVRNDASMTNHRWNTCICNYSKDRICNKTLFLILGSCKICRNWRLLDDQDCCSQMNHMHFTTIPKYRWQSLCSSSWVYVEFVGTHKGYRQKLCAYNLQYKYKLGHRCLRTETRERPLPHLPHTTYIRITWLLMPSIKIQDHYRYNDYLEAFNQ